jgi:hypothetical protein
LPPAGDGIVDQRERPRLAVGGHRRSAAPIEPTFLVLEENASNRGETFLEEPETEPDRVAPVPAEGRHRVLRAHATSPAWSSPGASTPKTRR